MVSSATVKTKASILYALTEAFENTYLYFLDLGKEELKKRENGSLAWYAIRDMLDELVNDMEELAGHMEVCDVILAIKSSERKGM